MNKPTVVILIVLFISLHYAATHLELLDFSGNVGLTLGLGESLSFVFNTLWFPICWFVGGLECGVFTDGGMSIGVVDLFNVFGSNAVGKIGSKLPFKSGISLVKHHDLRQMNTSHRLPPQDSPCTRQQFFGFWAVSRETLLWMGNEYTTIAGTFHSTKDTGSSRCTLQTNIEVAFEGLWCIFFVNCFGEF